MARFMLLGECLYTHVLVIEKTGAPVITMDLAPGTEGVLFTMNRGMDQASNIN